MMNSESLKAQGKSIKRAVLMGSLLRVKRDFLPFRPRGP